MLKNLTFEGSWKFSSKPAAETPSCQPWRTHLWNLDTHAEHEKGKKNFPQTLKPRDSNFSPAATSPFPWFVHIQNFRANVHRFIYHRQVVCIAFFSMEDNQKLSYGSMKSWTSFLWLLITVQNLIYCHFIEQGTILIALYISLPLVSPNSSKGIIGQ